METTLTAGELREQVYVELLRAGAVAYPNPPFGHHPNFRGAGEAAEQLLDYLFAARLRPGMTVLSYPDYVLRPLRQGLLKRGVHVIVPAKYGKGYRLLESGRVDPGKGSSIAGAEQEGQWLGTLPAPGGIAACFVACVALSRRGQWLGKGYGFRLPGELRKRPCYALAHPLMLRGALPEAEGELAAFATPVELVLVGK